MAQILDPKWIDCPAGHEILSDGSGGMETRPRYQVLVDGASISWDMDLGLNAEVTLGGSRTLENPTHLRAGDRFFLVVKQDEVGSHTLGFGNAYVFAGGTAPTVSATAGAVDVLEFVCDGEVVYLVGIVQAVA